MDCSLLNASYFSNPIVRVASRHTFHVVVPRYHDRSSHACFTVHGVAFDDYASPPRISIPHRGPHALPSFSHTDASMQSNSCWRYLDSNKCGNKL